MIGMSGHSCRMRSISSRPPMPGITRSVMTRSTAVPRLGQNFQRLLPLFAVKTL